MPDESASPQLDPARASCEHAGYHSAVGKYSRDSKTLRYVLVCDDCGEEVRQLSALDYVPRPVFAVA